jgi:hypothetical protein
MGKPDSINHSRLVVWLNPVSRDTFYPGQSHTGAIAQFIKLASLGAQHAAEMMRGLPSMTARSPSNCSTKNRRRIVRF